MMGRNAGRWRGVMKSVGRQHSSAVPVPLALVCSFPLLFLLVVSGDNSGLKNHHRLYRRYRLPPCRRAAALLPNAAMRNSFAVDKGLGRIVVPLPVSR